MRLGAAQEKLRSPKKDEKGTRIGVRNGSLKLWITRNIGDRGDKLRYYCSRDDLDCRYKNEDTLRGQTTEFGVLGSGVRGPRAEASDKDWLGAWTRAKPSRKRSDRGR